MHKQITVDQLIEKRKVMIIYKEMIMNIGITSIDLVWPTRLIFLAMGELLCDGFDLAVLNPGDRRGHDTYLYHCH